MIRFVDGHPDGYTGIPDGNYYTAKEFAEMMDVNEGQVRIWIRRGNVLCVNYFGRNYIPEDTSVVFRKRGRPCRIH